MGPSSSLPRCDEMDGPLHPAKRPGTQDKKKKKKTATQQGQGMASELRGWAAGMSNPDLDPDPSRRVSNWDWCAWLARDETVLRQSVDSWIQDPEKIALSVFVPTPPNNRTSADGPTVPCACGACPPEGGDARSCQRLEGIGRMRECFFRRGGEGRGPSMYTTYQSNFAVCWVVVRSMLPR